MNEVRQVQGGGVIEWAALATRRVVVATPTGAWFADPAVSRCFALPMAGPGSVATTRNLLDGVARAAWASTTPAPRPPLTPARWAYRLCGFYQTTHATPPLMRIASRRFAEAGREALSHWAATKAREEAGHDVLALRDLAALGYDAEETVKALVPAGAAALVAYFEQTVNAADPVGCVGYAYALERQALCVDADFINSVEASLPAGVRATRCLRVHSGSGSDPKHVEETVELVASLSAEERSLVAGACFDTALLCTEPAKQEIPSEQTLQQTLQQWLHPFQKAEIDS